MSSKAGDIVPREVVKPCSFQLFRADAVQMPVPARDDSLVSRWPISHRESRQLLSSRYQAFIVEMYFAGARAGSGSSPSALFPAHDVMARISQASRLTR